MKSLRLAFALLFLCASAFAQAGRSFVSAGTGSDANPAAVIVRIKMPAKKPRSIICRSVSQDGNHHKKTNEQIDDCALTDTHACAK